MKTARQTARARRWMSVKPGERTKQILKLREENPGLSQAELADLAGCRQNYVSLVLRIHTATPKAPVLLTTGEAAEYLHVHPNTLRRYDAKIPHYTFGIRGDRRYRKEDLDTALGELLGRKA